MIAQLSEFEFGLSGCVEGKSSELFPDAVDKDVARLAHPTADHEHFRIDDASDGCKRFAEKIPDLFNHLQCHFVPLPGFLEDFFGREDSK